MKYLLIPFGALLGWFIIKAEPAVHTLKSQVEELSQGAIKAKTMELALSLAIAFANGLAMYRVISGVNIMYFIMFWNIVIFVVDSHSDSPFKLLMYDQILYFLISRRSYSCSI